jgi:hypothetical protein
VIGKSKKSELRRLQMSDTKKAKTTQDPSTENEKSKNTKASPASHPQETIGNAQVTAEFETEKGFLGAAEEGIREGAHKVPEKAAEFGDTLVGKLKKGISKAYETGTKVVDELSQIAHEYVEKHKAESKINKLKDQKDMLMTQLGQLIFRRHLAAGKLSESFLNNKELIDLFNQIDMLDQKIIETGELLDREKE